MALRDNSGRFVSKEIQAAHARLAARGDRMRSLIRDKYNYPAKLVIDDARFMRTLAYIQGIARAGPEAAAKALNRLAFRWHREIVRHCPVENGLLRASFVVDPANPNTNPVVAQVGTGVPYIVFLEFGNKHIAGGKVRDWKQGDPPILSWPAKDGELTVEAFQATYGGQHATARRMLVQQKSGGREEFMPPMRGSWDLIADTAMLEVRDTLADMIRRGLV